MSHLDPATLAAIDSLELRSRHIVEGLMTGMHRSPHTGFSIEFAQHRQYAAGDDLRHLDWKVFGRTDKLHLKQYQKETTLDLVLLVDTSGSMAYSSLGRAKRPRTKFGREAGLAGVATASPRWRKFDHAAALASALAFLATRQQDRVGLVLFADSIRAMIKPSNAKGHWHTIVEALAQESVEPASLNPHKLGTEAAPIRRTDLGRLFDQITAQLHTRCVIVLISDLFDDTTAIEHGLALIHHRRHDLFILQTLDDAELNFPFRSPSEFFGLEDEGRRNIDPAALRQAYLESLNRHLQGVEAMTRRFGFDHLLLNTHESLGPPLSHFLARRMALVARRG